jgi:hypothetical protein
MISKEIDILKKTRLFLLNFVSNLNPEQMNRIPAGFNNNIIWNLGHMVAAQQGVCYRRGNLPLLVAEEFFASYKPESTPGEFVLEQQIEQAKHWLISTIDDLKNDYDKGLFAQNPAWTNRYGVVHENINDSIKFLLYHDGIHLGYIMALKRLVSS